MSALGKILGAWNTFWFAEVDARPMAAVRIGTGAVALWMFSWRLQIAASAYSDAGWMTRPLARAYLDSFWALPGLGGAPEVTIGLMLLGMVGSLAMVVGWHSRVASWLTFAVIAWMHARNSLLVFGGDSVLRLLIFYVALARSGAVWSLDGLRARREEYALRLESGRPARLPVAAPRRIPVWPLRLIQFQLALMYLRTGVAKCFGPTWLQGSALHYGLVNPLYSRFATVASAAPAFDVFTRWASWITLAWELVFVPACFHRWGRRLVLGIGVAVHLGIGVLMNVQFFAVVVLVGYCAFVPGRRMRALELSFVRALRGRLLHDAPRVVYDDQPRSRAMLSWLLAADHFRVLDLIPVGEVSRWQSHTQEELGPGIHVIGKKGQRLEGATAFRAVAAVCPALALALPVVLTPGIGHLIRRRFLARV